MLIQEITDQGITRLWTRRDRLRAAIKLILGLCAAVVCLYVGEGIASMLAGSAGTLRASPPGRCSPGTAA